MALRERLKEHSRIVVKVGTTTLTYPNGHMNLRRMEKLCRTLTDLNNTGREVILVTSGAIAAGKNRLKLPERPRDIRGKQAASAVGQAVLMQMYENFFSTYNQNIAQILLTKDVVEDEVRKTNTRNTFFTLLSMGIVPIVNENDTVSTDELGFSDNDTLSAYVSIITDADLLIILSDVGGLYESDPKKNPYAKLIDEVTEFTAELDDMAGDTADELGTGGMHTKLTAAKMAVEAGIDAVIADGDEPDVIFNIVEGAVIGTLFAGRERGN